MTDTEKTEIINAIIAHLKANSATISQLTNINSLTNRDYFEVAGGKRISYISLRDALKEYISPLILADFRNAISGKQNAEEGKGLSTNDYTDADKAKLEGIDDGANDYVHPATHSAEMITETDEKLFFTPAERQKLQGLENVPADWVGTQSEYNALTAKDAGRWYFITDGDEVVAVYRGSTLIHATANLVGQFADDSVPEDWYWWPNGVKTALPVDPVTKRFSFYWPEVLQTASYLFAGGANSFSNTKLIRLERIPLIAKLTNALCGLNACETYPVIDCSEVAPTYDIYYDVNYVILNSKLPRDIYFRNTEKITQFEMVINNGETSSTPTRVWGLDFSRVQALKNLTFGIATCIIQGVNLGKRQELSVANLYAVYWGNDTVQSGSRQSVVDTLLANSFDRATAGYSPVTLQLSEQTVAALTADEIAAITAKGYTITSHSTPPYN